MKITISQENPCYTFGNLEKGALFVYDGALFVKLCNPQPNENAQWISKSYTGKVQPCVFFNNTKISPVSEIKVFHD